MITLTCITSQLERRAGTRGEASCSRSGSAKLAKATQPKAIGVAAAGTRGELQLRSTSNWVRVQPQARKQSDS